MCGLAGVYSFGLNEEQINIAKELTWLSSLRGRDSTGLMGAWRKQGKTTLSSDRAVLPADAYLGTPGAKHILGLPKLYMIGAHTRYATVGAVTKLNAHPLTEGEIVGCHNGAADQFKAEALKEGVNDSRLLFRSIGEKGAKKALQELGQDAAYALQWVDLQERTLNFIHNWKRPLAFMFDRDETTLFWASEIAMLELVAKRYGPNGFKPPYEVPVDTLISVELGSLDFQEEKLISIITPTKNPPRDCSTMFPRLAEKIERETLFLPKPISEPWSPDKAPMALYLGWEGKSIAFKKASEYLKQGCRMCLSGPTRLSNSTPVWWIARDQFLCNECRDSELAKTYLDDAKIYKGEVKIIQVAKKETSGVTCH